MQAEKMWKVGTGEGITVAVIDSGVGETASLQGKLLPGQDVSGKAGGANDDVSGHGTTMAELIAGTGEGGLQGLAPGVTIFPVRTATGQTEAESNAGRSTLDKAIRTAADSRAQILNISLGGEYSAADERAVKYAASKGKLIFAAAGNDAEGENKADFPALLTEVVGVGAVDKKGTIAKFSSHGKVVDIAAPGSDIPTYCDKALDRYCTGDGGTSAATALTSASAALIWSKHPEWTANQVLNVLIDTAGEKTPSTYLGWGIVKPRLNLLENKGDPGAPDHNPLMPAGADASASPAPDAPATAEDAKADAKAKAADRTDKTAAESEDDGNPTLWVALAAALVLGAGGGAYALIRRRPTA
ncbi:S8 family serine peptidase [Streptomyces polyrhachis]|uniref:S8 family serine peptidase n=2 Tax=Streptomyces polyrhachis TaxID=1282885 RepID=A0ABW2GHL7_9ACTN